MVNWGLFDITNSSWSAIMLIQMVLWLGKEHNIRVSLAQNRFTANLKWFNLFVTTNCACLSKLEWI